MASIFLWAGSAVAADDGAGMPHAAAGRRGKAGDKANHRFGDVGFDEFGGLFFGITADLAHHDNALRWPSAWNASRQSIKFVPLTGSPPMPMQVVCPIFFWVSWREHLVGQGAGAGNHPDPPGL
jgi:hypothetical protein